MASILVIDDEPGIRTTIKDILEDEHYQVFSSEDGPCGLDILDKEKIDIVILDVWLPKMGGIDVLKAIRKDHPVVETIVISGHASIDMAVHAVKLGAFDFIEKPLSIERLLTSVRNAKTLYDLKIENTKLKSISIEKDEIIGSSEKMLKLKELIEQSARSDARVLITGDNGTGKELVARQIHALSERATGPFVAVNCAAIPDTLIESELFGHEKGSFTDASSRRKGKFETAHGGTLFLDEIADMSLQAQAKVLRVIQEMRFERIGGEQAIDVDVRLIAATNKDLKKEISSGRFREDLFFRLNVIPLHIPALRERREDISDLVLSFLEKLSAGKTKKISKEAMDYITAQDWPGNVRELKNFIERISVMSDEDEISLKSAEFFLRKASGAEEPVLKDRLEELFSLRLTEARESFEKGYLVHNLKKTEYNIAKAAELMGLYPSNLHVKIRKLGIEAKE